jgi:hypothetical protein
MLVNDYQKSLYEEIKEIHNTKRIFGINDYVLYDLKIYCNLCNVNYN